MARFFRRLIKEDDALAEAPGLSLQTEGGALEVDFPAAAITQIRQMIARIESRTALPASLALVAAMREEGVTYLSWGTATTLANDLPADVCLVDFNWWYPAGSGITGPDYPGLGALLSGEARLNDVLVTTNLSNLVILPAGRLPAAERSSAVRSPALHQILKELRERFDYLVFDIPALLAVSEAVTLAGLADAACVVVHQGITSANQVRQALDEIQHLHLLGVIMNQVETHTPPFLMKLLPTE